MKDAQDPFWHRSAVVGDEFKGEHLSVIHYQTDDYIIYTPKENDNIIHYYYSNDVLKDNLNKIEGDFNELKLLLPEGHPRRRDYLKVIASIYSLVFDNEISKAKSAIASTIIQVKKDNAIKINNPIESSKHGQSKSKPHTKFLLISIIGFIVTALLIWTYFKLYKDSAVINNQFFYLILIGFGVGCSALLYGITNTYGTLKGEVLGAKYQFSGPVVAVILTVAGWFYLPKNVPSEQSLKTLNIRIFDTDNQPIDNGRVKVYIDGDLNIQEQKINSDGQVILSGIPIEKFINKIKIVVRSPGYSILSVDTVLKSYVVDLTLKKNNTILITGKIKSASELPIENAEIKIDSTQFFSKTTTDGSYILQLNNNDKYIKISVSHKNYETKTILFEIKSPIENFDISLNPKKSFNVQKIDISPKTSVSKNYTLGQSTEGGIIFYLEDNGKHGLIVSELDLSNDIAWWIRNANFTTNSYSTIDGNANTTNIISEQGNNGAYAAKICRDYNGGGYSNWFLPSLTQLTLLYSKKKMIEGWKGKRYWSSTANGNNAWFIDFESGEQGVDYPITRYSIRAIRSF